ncbi:MAG: hypothetical protein WAZ27_00690 [Minisyncoccia bacterium]
MTVGKFKSKNGSPVDPCAKSAGRSRATTEAFLLEEERPTGRAILKVRRFTAPLKHRAFSAKSSNAQAVGASSPTSRDNALHA